MEYMNTTQNFLFLPLNLDTILTDLTPEHFANISVTNQIKLNKIDEFWKTVNSLFNDVFGLLSSRNFTSMATWRNDFSLSTATFSSNKQVK